MGTDPASLIKTGQRIYVAESIERMGQQYMGHIMDVDEANDRLRISLQEGLPKVLRDATELYLGWADERDETFYVSGVRPSGKVETIVDGSLELVTTCPQIAARHARRRHARVPVTLRCAVVRQTPSRGRTYRLTGTTINLSAGGALLLLLGPPASSYGRPLLEAGDLIDIELQTESHARFPVRARVLDVRSAQSRSRQGWNVRCTFTRMDESTALGIEVLVLRAFRRLRDAADIEASCRLWLESAPSQEPLQAPSPARPESTKHSGGSSEPPLSLLEPGLRCVTEDMSAEHATLQVFGLARPPPAGCRGRLEIQMTEFAVLRADVSIESYLKDPKDGPPDCKRLRLRFAPMKELEHAKFAEVLYALRHYCN
jgi:c-di-GMP-binding flagellar brake protein YcgR